MSGIKERLIKSASYYGLSIRKFEEKCHLNRSVISNMSENSSIGSDKLANIFDEFTEISPDWLINGHGEMLRSSVNQSIVGDHNTGIQSTGNHSTIQHTTPLENNVSSLQQIIKEKDERLKEKDERIEDFKSNIDAMRETIKAKDKLIEFYETLEASKKPVIASADERVLDLCAEVLDSAMANR